MGEVRLQKFIAACGLASRRGAEDLIQAGRVEVNGETVTVLGTKIDPACDEIRVDGVVLERRRENAYFMLHKPRCVVSTMSDPQGRPTVKDYLHMVTPGRGPRRVFHVGRLDFEAEGLLLLTNDGDLAQALTHSGTQVPQTYHVKVEGHFRTDLLQKLRRGVELEDGLATVQTADLLRSGRTTTWLTLTVTEGSNRLVRRLCEALGHPVLRLMRVAFGGVELGRLPPGKVRDLESREITRLRQWRAGRRRPS